MIAIIFYYVDSIGIFSVSPPISSSFVSLDPAPSFELCSI